MGVGFKDTESDLVIGLLDPAVTHKVSKREPLVLGIQRDLECVYAMCVFAYSDGMCRDHGV